MLQQGGQALFAPQKAYTGRCLIVVGIIPVCLFSAAALFHRVKNKRKPFSLISSGNFPALFIFACLAPDNKSENMDGQYRKDIYPGLEVAIILKKDQRSGKRTYGIVKDLLTSAAYHTRGIKVRLEDGQVGRVIEIDPILPDED